MLEKNISRRELLRAIGLGAAGVTIAACAPPEEVVEEEVVEEEVEVEEEEAEPVDDGVTIEWWIFWTQPSACEDAWWATDEWQELKGNNTVDFKTGAGGDAGLTAVAGGNPPDVGGIGHYVHFMRTGTFLPLEDHVAASDIVNEEEFLEGNWKMGAWEGEQVGIPAMECYVRRGLNYNARMVEEAGLDPDDPPVTWREVFEWHEKLTKFDDAGNLEQIGLDPYDAEGGSSGSGDGFYLAECWEVDYYDPDRDPALLVDTDAMAQAFETTAEFYRHMGPDNLEGLRSVEGHGSWGGAYNSEVQAMIIEGYWHPGETRHEAPEISEVNRATWAPVPEFRAGDKIQLESGHVHSLFKEGEHAEDAFFVIEFLQTDACCDIIYDTIGWLPALKDYIAAVDPTGVPGLKFYLDSVDEATHLYHGYRIPIADFLSDKVEQYREAVYRDQMTAEEAVAELQTELNEEWEAVVG